MVLFHDTVGTPLYSTRLVSPFFPFPVGTWYLVTILVPPLSRFQAGGADTKKLRNCRPLIGHCGPWSATSSVPRHLLVHTVVCLPKRPCKRATCSLLLRNSKRTITSIVNQFVSRIKCGYCRFTQPCYDDPAHVEVPKPCRVKLSCAGTI